MRLVPGPRGTKLSLLSWRRPAAGVITITLRARVTIGPAISIGGTLPRFCQQISNSQATPEFSRVTRNSPHTSGRSSGQRESKFVIEIEELAGPFRFVPEDRQYRFEGEAAISRFVDRGLIAIETATASASRELG